LKFGKILKPRSMMVAAGLVAVIGVSQSGKPGPASLLAEIERGPRHRHHVCLTFDAGGVADGLPTLLDELDVAKVRCTFFLTGRWAAKYPALAKEIHRRGHEIGNHTWSHPDLTGLDDKDIRLQLEQADAALKEVTGRSTKPLFRAPFGARDRRVLRVTNEAGYVSVYWSLDSLDSVDPPKSARFLVDRVTGRNDEEIEGGIILMHVGEPSTVQAVPAILSNLASRGFSMVKVSKLQADGNRAGFR